MDLKESFKKEALMQSDAKGYSERNMFVKPFFFPWKIATQMTYSLRKVMLCVHV